MATASNLDFFKVLYEPPPGGDVRPRVDIVVLHGLNPTNTADHAYMTWTKNGKLWLKDFLPKKLPESRIMMMGYNANIAFQSSNMNLQEHAAKLLVNLELARKDCANRPLLFIGHSMGGLVIKRAVVHAIQTKKYAAIHNSTYAMIFFATPHKGGNFVEFGKFLASIVRRTLLQPSNTLLKSLEKGSFLASELTADFRHRLEDYHFLSFVETVKLRSFGIIVDKDSATLGLADERETVYPLQADHSSICQFEDPEGGEYPQVEGLIVALAKDAIKAEEIQQRLEVLGRPQAQLINIDLNQLYKQLEIMNNRIKDDQDTRASIATAELRSDIVKWLAASEAYVSFNTAKQKRAAETGNWFIESYFHTWSIANNSMLWLSGIPGCGKTVLSSTIIQEVLSRQRPEQAIVYFFFEYDDRDNQSSSSVIRSLITQLLTQSPTIPKVLATRYNSCKLANQKATAIPIEDFLTIMRSMIETFDQTFIVLDALDECGDLDNLFEGIATISSWDLESLHCLLTSRLDTVDHHSEQVSANHYRLESTVINKDISRYIRQTLSNDIALKRWKEKTYATMIEHEILMHACGMFQYATCQLEILKKCITVRGLKLKLASMPTTLDGTYDRILKAIPLEYIDIARSMLCWLAHARRPLKVQEIVDALAFLHPEDEISTDIEFDPESRLVDTKDITEICSSLIEVVDTDEANTKQVRLAHNSIRDYIVSSRMPANLKTCFHLDQEASHVLIAKDCLAYLLQFTTYETLNVESLLDFPLARYAAEFWPVHARMADEGGSSTKEMIFRLLFDNREALRNWLRLFDPDDPEEGPDLDCGGSNVKSSLYYASLLGLTGILSSMIDKGLALNDTNKAKGNCLQAASYAGFQNTVLRLLSLDAEINFRYLNEPDALQAAAYAGHISIVKLLLDLKTDPNGQGGLFSTALQAAAYKGHTEILKLLLEKGADIDAVGGRFDSALSAAAWSGQLSSVQFLLSRGANINLQGPQVGTPVQAAAHDGHGVVEVLKVLVAANADVSLVAGGKLWFGTALQAAAISGYLEHVQIILDAGAEVDQRGGRYGTALQAAAADGADRIVDLLLQNGADINIEGGEHGSALQAAINCRRYNVERRLREELAQTVQ